MTYDALRRQYAANATGMQQLADKAERTGRKVNGQTADFWRAGARRYRGYSTLTDAELAAHLKASQASVTARLAEIRRHAS